MEIEEIKKKIEGLDKTDLLDFIKKAVEDSHLNGFNEGYEDGEQSLDDSDESAANIEFCLNELKEAQERNLSIDELIRDLTIRSCKFMKPTAKILN